MPINQKIFDLSYWKFASCVEVTCINQTRDTKSVWNTHDFTTYWRIIWNYMNMKMWKSLTSNSCTMSSLLVRCGHIWCRHFSLATRSFSHYLVICTLNYFYVRPVWVGWFGSVFLRYTVSSEQQFFLLYLLLKNLVYLFRFLCILFDFLFRIFIYLFLSSNILLKLLNQD